MTLPTTALAIVAARFPPPELPPPLSSFSVGDCCDVDCVWVSEVVPFTGWVTKMVEKTVEPLGS